MGQLDALGIPADEARAGVTDAASWIMVKTL
jgi:hypothetical protein